MKSIEELQTFIDKGGLNTAFVIEAVNRYASEVLAKEQELLKLQENWFIDPKAWINCAKECTK